MCGSDDCGGKQDTFEICRAGWNSPARADRAAQTQKFSIRETSVLLARHFNRLNQAHPDHPG